MGASISPMTFAFLRLPRHAASMPIAMGVSCSADRQIKAKITRDGVFIEQLEHNPAQFLPSDPPELAPAVPIDLTLWHVKDSRTTVAVPG